MSQPILTQLFKIVPTSTLTPLEPLPPSEFVARNGGDTQISPQLATSFGHDKRKACNNGVNAITKFQFNPLIHSTTNWTQSQRYGHYFDILCENGSTTNFVVCKTCRARFSKRSTESLK
ncbi:hypothetical protein niasHT_006792 [Heterodera trifolii]|uniref:BED-type domain-containing protein n=1 Tax=Heterodera trifolii TaxID=157864 RepID=A0ABD2MA23_9BILA